MSRRRRIVHPQVESLEKLTLLSGSVVVPDLVASSQGGIIEAFKNNGSGGFTQTNTNNGFSAQAGYGDLFGNGLTDIVQVTGAGVTVYQPAGAGNFTALGPFPFPPQQPADVPTVAAVGNFTGHTNGLRDIAVLAHSNNGRPMQGYALYIFTNEGGAFRETSRIQLSNGDNHGQNDTGTLTVGDFLKNGRDQVVITTNGANGTDPGLYFAQGNGTSAPIPLPAGQHAVGATAVDYNNNGTLDLAVEVNDDNRQTPTGDPITLDLLTGDGQGGFNFTSSQDTDGMINTGTVGIVSGNFGGTAPSLAVPVAGDAGFENVSVGSGGSAYRYNPTGSFWTFSSQSGVSGNGSAFTAGNPSAPQGSQVAFLQSTGSFSQSIANWNAGSYQINFLAAQRGNGGTPNQTIQVLVDGTSVGIITPTSTSYSAYTTPTFSVADGSHTITFQGLNSSGDNTAFLDSIAVAAPAPIAGDAGFESVPVGSGFVYDPTGSSWTFSGQSGVSGDGSAFTAGNPSAPQGSQVAFLQNQGSFNQSVANWVGGVYQINFSAAQRGNYGTSNQTIQVLVDGKSVGIITPTSTSYSAYTTLTFNITTGSHTITFQGLNSSGDNTAFLDSIAIVQSPATSPAATLQVAVPLFSVTTGQEEIKSFSISATGVWGDGSVDDSEQLNTGNEVNTGNIIAADFNGDGITDIAYSSGSTLYVLLSDLTTGETSPAVAYDLGNRQDRIGAGKFF